MMSAITDLYEVRELFPNLDVTAGYDRLRHIQMEYAPIFGDWWITFTNKLILLARQYADSVSWAAIEPIFDENITKVYKLLRP